MSCLFRVITCTPTSAVVNHCRFAAIRSLCVTSVDRLKQIDCQDEDGTLTISARRVPSPREQFLLKPPSLGCACYLCALNLKIKHTDVLILSQFLRHDGCMLGRRITGLCSMQQRKVTTLVAMSQKAGLMPNIAPADSNRDPKRRFGYKKFNKYYDENTIEYPRVNKYRFYNYMVKGGNIKRPIDYY